LDLCGHRVLPEAVLLLYSRAVPRRGLNRAPELFARRPAGSRCFLLTPGSCLPVWLRVLTQVKLAVVINKGEANLIQPASLSQNVSGEIGNGREVDGGVERQAQSAERNGMAKSAERTDGGGDPHRLAALDVQT